MVEGISVANPRRPILQGKADFPLTLAPMVGLSHVAFREMVQTYVPCGARVFWPTEMLNSRRLPYERFSEVPETRKGEAESKLVPQILGNEEKFISESVRRLENEWGAEGIDINMGCPVRKALQHNYGVALMGDSDYAAKVVEMTVRHTRLPVSVKLRSGADSEDLDFLLRFAKGLENAGAAWITLHPRLGNQGRRGTAKWETVTWLRERISIPVIGNGDVQTADDVFQMMSQSHCDSVMVGRALTARPWLFWQVGERLGLSAPPGREGRAPQTPEEEGAEFGRALLILLDRLQFHFVESLGVRRFKFFLKTGAPWLSYGNTLQGLASRETTLVGLRECVSRFFETPQAMAARTDWRQ